MRPYRAIIHRITPPASLPGAEDPVWDGAETLQIDQFRPEGSLHRPQTSLQLVHDDRSLFGLFRVRDQYVRCVHRNYGDPVYRDSCVELFVQPKAGCGYFNFEFNCGGAFLCNHITDPTRVGDGFKEYIRLTAKEVAGVRVATSLPAIIEPELTQSVSWWLAFGIPVGVVEPFVGPMGALGGQVWRANAYKCGSETSHPHWAAWAPVDELNFHLPRCFGELVFT